ncbi:hypothetical protein NDU88_003215 [Pleurodeles waltl]|uniref:Uncharacterized protein n=1 Tax=Pleurodeles waltl TaxID=8319 RepID=A0AAV7T455_PLEWA|nr:hypothetical protein NDU88_003215 [Pleurodeles waltl]
MISPRTSFTVQGHCRRHLLSKYCCGGREMILISEKIHPPVLTPLHCSHRPLLPLMGPSRECCVQPGSPFLHQACFRANHYPQALPSTWSARCRPQKRAKRAPGSRRIPWERGQRDRRDTLQPAGEKRQPTVPAIDALERFIETLTEQCLHKGQTTTLATNLLCGSGRADAGYTMRIARQQEKHSYT